MRSFSRKILNRFPGAFFVGKPIPCHNKPVYNGSEMTRIKATLTASYLKKIMLFTYLRVCRVYRICSHRRRRRSGVRKQLMSASHSIICSAISILDIRFNTIQFYIRIFKEYQTTEYIYPCVKNCSLY